MELPWSHDLVGLLWEEAEPILRARSLTYHTLVTRPPTRPVGVGPLRVVAELPRDGGLLIVLAHRDYQRGESAQDPAGQGGLHGRV